MKLIVIFMVSSVLLLTGCTDSDCINVPSKQTVIATKCPKFNTKLRIRVEDLNSSHGAVSWADVSRIESFLLSKKNFNKNIDKLNTK